MGEEWVEGMGKAGEGKGDLQSKDAHAFLDGISRAILCISWLCRRIHSTRLVDQPALLSCRSCCPWMQG